MRFDAFICYASEDKDSLVHPLAEKLTRDYKLKIWYDQFILKVGDSLLESINHGLANSDFGIVILSRKFFSKKKKWTKKELGALVHKEILLIRHSITMNFIKSKYPVLADIYMLSTEDDDINSLALKLAAKIIKNPLLEEYNYADRFERRELVKALGKMGPATVEPLIRALDDDDGCVRFYAIRSLGEIGDPRAVEPLIYSLDDEFSNAQSEAEFALGKMGPAAVEPLIRALEDDYEDVRTGAAGALGEIGDPRAVEPLIKLLQRGDTYGVIAVYSLAKIDDLRGIEYLIGILDGTESSTSVEHKCVVARALGRATTRYPQAVEALIRALNSPDEKVRYESIKALGKRGNKKAIEKLKALSQDGDEKVRLLAKEALKKIQD